MKWNEVFCNTFQSIGREIGLNVQMVEGYLACTPLDPDDPRYSTDFILEDHATASQKERGIDLLEFLQDSLIDKQQ